MSNYMHHKIFTLLLSSALLPLPAPALAAFDGNDRSNVSGQLDGSTSSLPLVNQDDEEPECFFLRFWWDEDKSVNYSVHKGDILSDIYIPSRRSYTFKGWMDTETNEMVPMDTAVTRSMELKAVWEKAEKITVKWVDDEGAILCVKQAYPGDMVEFNGRTPSKSGYILDGWKRIDTGEIVSVLEIKEEDRDLIRLVPNWAKYTQWCVEWRDKYDYLLDWTIYTMVEGDSYPVLEKPWEYIDYSEVDGFLGWFDQYGNSYEIGQVFEATTPTNINLRPKFDTFTHTTVKIDFYLDQDLILLYDSHEVNVGERVDCWDIPDKTGYKFLYWAYATTGNEFDFSTRVDENINLYAVWEELPVHTIYWMDEDLTSFSTQTAYTGDWISCPSSIYLNDSENYRLSGWKRSDTGEVLGRWGDFQITEGTAVDIVMTPVIEPIQKYKTVNVEWLDMRGVIRQSQTYVFKEEDQTFELIPPITYMEDSGFMGWYDSEDNILEEGAVLTDESPNSLIYQARCQSTSDKTVYTVILKSKGQVSSTRQFLLGDKVFQTTPQPIYGPTFTTESFYSGYKNIGWTDADRKIWEFPFTITEDTPETLELTYMYAPLNDLDNWVEIPGEQSGDPSPNFPDSPNNPTPDNPVPDNPNPDTPIPSNPGSSTDVPDLPDNPVIKEQYRTIIWQKDNTILYVQNLKIGSKVSVFKLASLPSQKFTGWMDTNGKTYSGTFTITDKTPEVLVLSPRWETIVQEDKPDTGNKLPDNPPIQAEPVWPDLPTPAVPTILPEGWKQAGQRWQYQKSDGTLLKNSWKQWLGRWYHFDENGFMETGWIRQQNNWYHLQNSGAMSTGWVKSGNAWYYLDNSGVMQTGWQKITWKGQPKWFYFDGSGAMKTGWLKLMWNGKADWYYFQADGTMKANDTLGKYRFDSAGKCLNP